MGRGRALKSKTKEKKALTKAELQARKEWEERKSNIPHQIKKLIVRLLENVDPLEAAGVLALTIFVKATIDLTEEFRGQIQALVVLGELPPGMKTVWSGIPFWYHLIPEGEEYEGIFPDWQDWIIAFGIAYMISKHGGALVQAATNMTSIIRGFLF